MPSRTFAKNGAMNTMYDHVVIEIAGKCNARCKWCVTGRANRIGKPLPGAFLEPETLSRAIAYLRGQGVIALDALFSLYNWGEPFLHPRFRDIAAVLAEAGHEYIVSSNLSRFVPFDASDALRKLRAVVVSMPGFSQASYDRIHGFSFERIKANIMALLDNYRSHGFQGKVQIKVHVYQFNLDEIPALLAFAKTHGIGVQPTFATFADLDLFMRYLENRLPETELRELGRDLLLDRLVKDQGEMPAGYDCPYYDALLLDETCNIVTCCMVTKEMDDFVIGNLFDTDPADIDRLKRAQPVCRRCLGLEIPYLIEKRDYPHFIDGLDLSLDRLPEDREIWLWGAGRMARDLAGRLAGRGHGRVRFIADALSLRDRAIPDDRVVSPDALPETDRPYVIVANEYIAPCLTRLAALGYRRETDFDVAAIVSRG